MNTIVGQLRVNVNRTPKGSLLAYHRSLLSFLIQ
jgi:hypothetical protein